MVILISLPRAALTPWALRRHIRESRGERAARQIDDPAAPATLGLCGPTYGCRGDPD